jgi:hypothetical protein
LSLYIPSKVLHTVDLLVRACGAGAPISPDSGLLHRAVPIHFDTFGLHTSLPGCPDASPCQKKGARPHWLCTDAKVKKRFWTATINNQSQLTTTTSEVNMAGTKRPHDDEQGGEDKSRVQHMIGLRNVGYKPKAEDRYSHSYTCSRSAYGPTYVALHLPT